jgi:hypothetical protein
MFEALREPSDIGRYLHALRELDRTAIAASGDEAAAVERLIDAHTVVMDHDPRGDGEPVEESLATWLSLLDDAAWRERVREVRVDAALLRDDREHALLAAVAAAVTPVAA